MQSALLDLAFYGMQALRQCGGRRYGTQPVGVVGVGVQQGEIHQAGRRFHLAAGDASRAQSAGVEAASRFA